MRKTVDRVERVERFAQMLRDLIETNMRNRPSFTDRAIVLSFGWYDDAHSFAVRCAEMYGLPINVAAGIVAAFSIRTRWNENLRDAEDFIRNPGIKPTGLSIRNKKALALLDAEHHWSNPSMDWIKSILGGKKISAFADNIALANDSDAATIDVWMCRAFHIEQKHLKTNGLYEDCQEAVRIVARELEMPVPAVQALVWILVRGSAD